MHFYSQEEIGIELEHSGRENLVSALLESKRNILPLLNRRVQSSVV